MTWDELVYFHLFYYLYCFQDLFFIGNIINSISDPCMAAANAKNQALWCFDPESQIILNRIRPPAVKVEVKWAAGGFKIVYSWNFSCYPNMFC